MTIYIQFSDCGTIRKWSREPFDGGVAYVPTERLYAAEHRSARAEDRLHAYRQSRAARWETMAAFIKARAPELWPDYAAVSVNGSIYSDELVLEPNFEREMNILRYRAERAEEEAARLRAMLPSAPRAEGGK